MKLLAKYLVLCFAVMLVMAGCKLFRKKSERVPEAHEEKRVAENIRLTFSRQEIDTSLIYSFYSQREFMPAWVDDPETTEEIMTLIEGAAFYGLDSADYSAGKIRYVLNRIKSEQDKELKNELFATADLQLTRAYLLFALHASKGRFDPETLEKRDSLPAARGLVPHLEQSLDKKKIRESIEALEPQQAEYRNLRSALAKYLTRVEISADTVVIPDPGKDSVACYAKVKEVLIAQGYLDSAHVSNDSLAIAALKRFQRLHGLTEDGKAGPNTRQALNISTYERYMQVAVNLERWRWESDWGKQYVLVNIPAYRLEAYNNGMKQLELKVIVGKASTPTPELSSHFDNIITNPFWHVPTSIYSKELLPEIKENPEEYLARHSYKVLDKNNKVVDPDSVNWDDAYHYRIRQDAGSANALGYLKFNFRNKYQVYLHDTPTRKLFNKETRSMSHGCVRVQNPIDLAEFLLNAGAEQHTVNEVEELISRGVNRHIELKGKVPLHIRYFTCGADTDLDLYFYRDVYNRDEALKKKLFNGRQQPVALL